MNRGIVATPKLLYGEEVLIPWGLDEVRGTVREVYGQPGHEHVIIDLTPELTGTVVYEATTVSLPIDSVKQVQPAA